MFFRFFFFYSLVLSFDIVSFSTVRTKRWAPLLFYREKRFKCRLSTGKKSQGVENFDGHCDVIQMDNIKVVWVFVMSAFYRACLFLLCKSAIKINEHKDAYLLFIFLLSFSFYVSLHISISFSLMKKLIIIDQSRLLAFRLSPATPWQGLRVIRRFFRVVDSPSTADILRLYAPLWHAGKCNRRRSIIGTLPPVGG